MEGNHKSSASWWLREAARTLIAILLLGYVLACFEGLGCCLVGGRLQKPTPGSLAICSMLFFNGPQTSDSRTVLSMAMTAEKN